MITRIIRAILEVLRRFSIGHHRVRMRGQDSATPIRPTELREAHSPHRLETVGGQTSTEVYGSGTGCEEQAVVVLPVPIGTCSEMPELIETALPAEHLNLGESQSTEQSVATETKTPLISAQDNPVEQDDRIAPPAGAAARDLISETLADGLSVGATQPRDGAISTVLLAESRRDSGSDDRPAISPELRSTQTCPPEGEHAQPRAKVDGSAAASIPLPVGSVKGQTTSAPELRAETPMDLSTSVAGGLVAQVDKGTEIADAVLAGTNEVELEPVGENRPAQEPKSRPQSNSRSKVTLKPHVAAPRLSAAAESPELPFLGTVLHPPSAEYLVWNKAIVHHCLQSSASEDGYLYLTITPTILAGALTQINGPTLPPDEATTRFVDAVSAMYRTCVLPHAKKLQVLRRCGEGGLPECVAFLALSVLAAYRMRTEDGISASAYYRRLEGLLRCGMSAGVPRGFDGDDFEGLWAFLDAWFLANHRRHIAMPSTDGEQRRFVALPLLHVPLRQVDIERLPDFFDWSGYEPGEEITTDKINSDLIQWTRARGGFTVSGMSALRDDRRPAVLAQIAQELECWDGSVIDLQGKHVTSVEVFLHWQRRLPVLSYLPRRPITFPATFNDGLHLLDAGQEGWYEPVPIDDQGGPELQSGFAWEADSNGVRFVLQRSGAVAIAMAPSEFDGPLSHRSLLAGAPGAVLCTDSVVDRVSQYLETVTGKRCKPSCAANVPAGWKLFVAVIPVRTAKAPDGLEMLDVTTGVEIIPSGGLRLGRRWAWVMGAAPTLVVTGMEPSVPIRIDGEAVDAEEDGTLRVNGLLSRPGVHLVEVGRVRRRLEIVLPELPTDTPNEFDRSLTATALPAGYWMVIGENPGEITYAASGRWGRGAVAPTAFVPVWAISFGAGRGAVVRPLAQPLPPPGRLGRLSTKRSRQQVQLWAEALYGAHIRRPRFCPAPTVLIDQGTHTAWSGYVSTAREVKRVLKSEPR
jgi:hypothetical protein